MILNDNQKNPNWGRAFIYTEECKLCGKTTSYSSVIHALQEKGYDVHVKQVSLWRGWNDEAKKIKKLINAEIPFVFVFNTKKGKSIEDAIKDGIDDIA